MTYHPITTPAMRRWHQRYSAYHAPLSQRIDEAIGRPETSVAPFLETPYDAEHQVLRAHAIRDELLTMLNGVELALGHVDGALAGNRDDQFHLRVATGYGIALREIRLAPLDILHGIEL